VHAQEAHPAAAILLRIEALPIVFHDQAQMAISGGKPHLDRLGIGVLQRIVDRCVASCVGSTWWR
jgi:hypothetical protein